jgi:excisionase family DNA binding protein
MERLLTREETAALLRKPVSWLRYAERRHLIPFVRVGQQIRYRASDLERWLEEGASPSAEARAAKGRHAGGLP